LLSPSFFRFLVVFFFSLSLSLVPFRPLASCVAYVARLGQVPLHVGPGARCRRYASAGAGTISPPFAAKCLYYFHDAYLSSRCLLSAFFLGWFVRCDMGADMAVTRFPSVCLFEVFPRYCDIGSGLPDMCLILAFQDDLRRKISRERIGAEMEGMMKSTLSVFVSL
jgi:hypothetical protein